LKASATSPPSWPKPAATGGTTPATTWSCKSILAYDFVSITSISSTFMPRFGPCLFHFWVFLASESWRTTNRSGTEIRGNDSVTVNAQLWQNAGASAGRQKRSTHIQYLDTPAPTQSGRRTICSQHHRRMILWVKRELWSTFLGTGMPTKGLSGMRFGASSM
jgi:hypothetical protein